jgi:hypothetical protein
MSKIAKKVPFEAKKVVDDLSKVQFSETKFKLKKSKKKHIVLYTIQDGNSRSIESVKRIDASTTHLSISKEEEVPFDISKDIFTHKNKAYYIVDLNRGQIHLDLDDTYKFNKRFLKKLVKDEIISQSFTRFTGQQTKMNLYIGLFFAIFGALIGYIIALLSLGVI